MEKEIITVKHEGEMKEAEVVLAFDYDGKDFVIYTFNETDADDMTVLYSSMVVENNGVKSFEKISDEDWQKVKEVMNDIVSDWEEQE